MQTRRIAIAGCRGRNGRGGRACYTARPVERAGT